MKGSPLGTVFILVLVLLGFTAYSYAQDCCYLPVPVIGQEESQWCWDASSECVIEFYGTGVTQGTMAQWACNQIGTWCVLPQTCDDCVCAPRQCATCCNQPNSLYLAAAGTVQDVLQHFGGISSSGIASEMTRAQILQDVCRPYCRPFIFRWLWYENGEPNGGHLMVGHGFCTSNDLVYYMDPLPVGAGHYDVGDYDWMVCGVHDPTWSHEWTHSLRLTTNGPTAVELASFDAVAHDGYIEVRWTTATEIDNAGFDIYRSLSKEGERFQISQGLIAAQGDELKGASYSFTDLNVTEDITYYYWLEDVDLQGRAAMHGPVSASLASVIGKPDFLTLAQNQPNPFKVTTEIRYGLPAACHVDVSILDVMGKKVATLVEGQQAAGYKVVRWDGRDENGLEVSGGIYFYRLKAGGHTDTNKMILMR